MDALRRFALVCAAVSSLGAGACAETSYCEAAAGGVERMRAESARQEAQIAWLRMQLATFAGELQARSAADREMLLQRLAVLEATNAALVARLDRAQGAASPDRALPAAARPTPAPPPPVVQPPAPLPLMPAAAPPPPPAPVTPPPRFVRQVEASKARGIDEASPY